MSDTPVESNSPSTPQQGSAAPSDAERDAPGPKRQPPPDKGEPPAEPGSSATAAQSPTKTDGDSVASDGNQNTVVGELKGDISHTIHNGLTGEDLKIVIAAIIEQTNQRRPLKETVNKQTVSPNDPPKDEQAFAEQFDKFSDEDKLFVVVLRLFPGINWMDFWMIYDLAAQELLPKPKVIKKVDKPGEEGEEQAATPPTRQARNQSDDYWAQVAHAEIKQTTYEYIEGKSTKTTIDFRSSEVRQIIENYLSSSQRQLLVRMLPVLWRLGFHAHVGIRQIAAEAIAVIANIDFDYVRREVIEDWSCRNEQRVRAAVGYIFDKILVEQKVDAEAIVTLSYWSDELSRKPWQQRWTAAASYKLIGLHRFDLAKQGLTSLARLVDKTMEKWQDKPQAPAEIIALITTIPDAVLHALVVLALRGKTSEIMDMLREWTIDRQDTNEFRLSDLTILATIVEVSYAALEIRKQQHAQSEQADFFDLLRDNKDFRKNLADILVYVIKQEPELRQGVLEMTQSWVEDMAEIKLDTEPVGRLIVNIFRRLEANNRDRILRAMHRWAKHKNNTVRTLGAGLEQKLLGANYPLPEPQRKRAEAPGSSGDERIVFGKR